MKGQLGKTKRSEVPAAGLSPCTFAVLHALEGLKNNRDECSPSLRHLAALMGFSQSSVRKAFRRLESCGMLVSAPRFSVDGGRNANLYTLRGQRV